MAEFKDMLKYYRTQMGMSQSQLAAKIGVATSTISMYEVGKRQPDFETEEKLADFFNVDLNTLRGKDIENALSKEQRDLLDAFDQLSEKDKDLVKNLIKSLTE